MKKILLTAGFLAATLAASAASAQQGTGPAAGATTGAIGGAIVGGPVGAVVGGAAGALVGGIAEANQPRFRQYVVTQGVPSYTYSEPLAVGSVLPSSGVRYYEVPSDYGVQSYRYTVVNGRPVLVDPGSRRVIQVID
jgi:hypothetical protein